MAPNTADVRRFLTDLFSDEELTTWCFDYFPEVYDNFTSGLSKGQKIHALLDYSRRREQFTDLLKILQQARPAQYAARLGPAGSPAPVSSPVPQSLTHTASAPVTSNVSGGVTLETIEGVNIGGDVTGRDKITQTTINIERATIIQSGASIAESKSTVEVPQIAVDAVHSPNKPMLPGEVWLSDQNNRRVIGGMEFVRVPAGKFLMGSLDTNPLAYDEEHPQHMVDIPNDYWLARYMVTNEQFAFFAGETDYLTLPKAWKIKSDHPVVDVSWNDAVAYCQWFNHQWRSQIASMIVRLPSEAEWEKAARGEYGNEWPWGNEFDPTKCNSTESGQRDTTPVGAYSVVGGDNFYGLADMAGNVFEWCHSLSKSYPYSLTDHRESRVGSGQRVLRGGTFNGDHRTVRCAFRSAGYPDRRYDRAGFRVVIAPPLPG